MTRRPFACSLLAAALLASMPLAAQQQDDYASIAQLQQRMDDGSLSSKTLTQDFLGRIQRIDRHGPALHSVLQTNPDAVKIAASLDARRSKRHGPLYGIPVLLKDNIDTGDRELTTAGSLALVDAPAPHDATVTAKLRAAGAVILGKANLSEWANYRSNHASSGWTGVGGQTKNPYALDRNPCGSSAGSAAAVAAGLATVAIGSETDGSIICPASMTGLVGIKPTLGLVSRAGIVPISANQDTAGPITRSVADAAALLSAIAGSDARDPATVDADKHATDYTKFLDPNGLRGKRIGVVRALGGVEPNADRVLDEAIAAMKAQGAIIVDPVQLPHLNELGDAESTVMQYDFKHDINAYLATRTGLKVHTLADLIAFDNAHAAEEMPWFGQELFEQAEARGPLTDPAYRDALAKAKQLSGPEGIDAALQSQHLDALLAPSWGPAFMTDLVLGDHVVSGDPTIGGPSQPAAVAGYPSITLPAGWAHGLPVGIVLFGAKWSEPTLISIAYGFEQHTHAWQAPKFLDTVDGKPVMASSK
ncbi:amidase [Rhodanobacter sp. DHB23]|uniref:amidase n=1 Tax=Rhodanobacter sp. DHB23 TaxID=2775923 RepID=UPI00177F6CB7|nr:amidase [Rhodanobacter sp. DHB23]MBD8873144.1 amidase [Rhodanobacter sp. DHB23]